jgi:hypothetical protein
MSVGSVDRPLCCDERENQGKDRRMRHVMQRILPMKSLASLASWTCTVVFLMGAVLDSYALLKVALATAVAAMAFEVLLMRRRATPQT